MARKIITGATLPFGKIITILGQTVDVDEMSLKCGVKAIDGIQSSSSCRLPLCRGDEASKMGRLIHSLRGRTR